MATLHLLGTGSANTSPDRTTTMLAVHDAGSSILVDCGGDVIHRMLAAGLGINSIDGIIITHEHPDHVAGFPLFMEKLWLVRRARPIPVYGIRPAIAQASRCWEAFDTEQWSGVPEIQWVEVDLAENAAVLSDNKWDITASPGVHGVPVVGLRIESKNSGGVVTYSCDTEPCATIERLAADSALLIHEANGLTTGHTSASQAAQVAASANAEHLVLVHLPAHVSVEEMEAAREIFPRTEIGTDLSHFDFKSITSG